MNKISLTSHEDIQKHLANNSPTKISFRFPRSKRFQQANPQCPIAFYSYHSHLSKRKSSIGTGKKIDFLREVKTPSSDKYDTDNYHNKIKHKGLTFGLSRQQSPDQSYLIPQLYKNPGPGKYQNQKAMNNNSSYSIRPKTIDTIERHLSYKNAPGPGTYEYVQLNPVIQKTKVSKYQNAKLCVATTSPRFLDPKDAPGPHSYLQLDNLSPNAHYIASHHRGKGTRPFTRQKRFIHDYWKPCRNPGPQQYEKPSDFGIYGDHNYNKGLSTIG